MLFSRLSANWKLAATSNRVLLVTNTLLSLSVICLSVMALGNRERVTIVPPTIDKPYTVSWSSGSPDYYKSMGLYFAGVIGMIGPRTQNYVISVIEMFANPLVAEGIKTKLRLQASSYEFRNSTASAWFEASQVTWEAKTQKVFVQGTLFSVASNKVESRQSVVYEFVIKVVEGKPRIDHFDSYTERVAHTLQWEAGNVTNLERDDVRKKHAEAETLVAEGEDIPLPPATLAEKKQLEKAKQKGK